MRKVLHLVRKELWQVSRDPNMLRIIFVVPMFQLLVLGYAITTDIKNLDILICDYDRSTVSRSIIERFSYTEYFNVKQRDVKPAEVEKYLFRSEVVLALVIPEDFGKELEMNRSPELQILVDGQNSNSSAVALGYSNRILLDFMSDHVSLSAARNPNIARNVKMITPMNQAWYNPELKSVYYMIPGIISILLTIITMLLTGMAIVKEREIGTLDQLMVTPIKSWQLIAGKTIPFALLGFVEISIAMTFGVLWFKVPIVGSLPFLALLAGIFIMTTLGLGIFVSTLVNTQQQSLFLTWFLMVTFIMLSGFFYPIENMPDWVQFITYANPLRYFIAILRELFLKGAGLNALWPELLSLLTIGVTIFSMAVLRFHKRAT